MRRIPLIGCAVVLWVGSGSRALPRNQAVQPAAGAITSIFDGRTTAGWHWSRTSHHGTTADASVEDGALVLRPRPFGQGGLLLSDGSYQDFELSLEARPDPDFNSGIFLRSTEGGSAYQIELVRPGNTGAWLGEMMRLGEPRYIGDRADINAVWKDGAWNAMRVRMVGEAPHVTLWINGVKLWELQMPANDQIGGRYGGMVGLQLHWTATYTNAAGVPYGSGAPWAVQRFRNMTIQELK
jgi:3-keto-disaccharide hydrolase